MNGTKILIFNADRRFEYTARTLEKEGFEVTFAKTDKSELIKQIAAAHTLILPLPVSRDGQTLNFQSLGAPLYLTELASAVSKGATVFGGIVTNEAKQLFWDKGVSVFDYYDEELISENALITAEALMLMFEKENIKLENKKILLTGFGRTACAVAELLKKYGADFTVCARSDEAQKLAQSKGYKFVKLKSFTGILGSFNMIINTVPALILDTAALGEMHRGAMIVDIASAPFGVTRENAEKYGMELIRALSLPGRFLPEKAGELIGRKVTALLRR